MIYTFYYRGPLSSCNYKCSYCPFSKSKSSFDEILFDKKCLYKFENWILKSNIKCSLFLCPYGEALIHDYYQNFIVSLSNSSNITKIVIQTNLSCNLNWIKYVNPSKFALWITFHPTEISIDKFLTKLNFLDRFNISYSVGCVGDKSNFEEIIKLRKNIDCKQYIWINAIKEFENYYTNVEIDILKSIDPLFEINYSNYESKNMYCKTGKEVFSIDGYGNITRCNFDKTKLGNIYKDDIRNVNCNNNCNLDECNCYIGYINLTHLGLDKIYKDQILERIYKKTK